MSYFIVFLVAAAAGLAVGFITLRQGRVAPADPATWTQTYREHPSAEGPSPVATSKRPLPPDPNPRTRKIGAAGLAGVVLGAAGMIALFAYVVWTVIKGIFSSPQL